MCKQMYVHTHIRVYSYVRVYVHIKRVLELNSTKPRELNSCAVRYLSETYGWLLIGVPRLVFHAAQRADPRNTLSSAADARVVLGFVRIPRHE